MYLELKKALKEEIARVAPLREEIRTLTGRERYNAWQEKRAGSPRRRYLHLANCFLKGTPYRKAESWTMYDVCWVPAYQRKDEIDYLICRVAAIILEFSCTDNKFVAAHNGIVVDKAFVESIVRAWVCEGTALPTADRPLKLYTVVRDDLPPGAQAVQAAHAMREFAAEHPGIEHEWHEKSNTIVFLATSHEGLCKLLDCAKQRGVETSVFREPDLDNLITAACFGTKGYKLPIRDLPLALKV